MKLSYILWIGWISLSLVTACKPNEGSINPEKPTNPEVEIPSFPKGQPLGAQTTFTITPEGGEYASPDSQIKLIIPAGAVGEPTTITMQSVENTGPAGLGKSVRLLPHTIEFKKPVTLQMSYAAVSDSVPSTNALSLAYQDEQGVWRLALSRAVDEKNKTVRVLTTHFSDWSIATAVRLLPFETTLSESEEQNFRLIQYVRIESYEEFNYLVDDDDLTPLVPPKVKVIYEGQPLNPVYVKADSWEINTADQTGELGRISAKPNSSEATYKAPSIISHPYQVGVSVAFNTTKGKIIFVATVNLAPGNSVSYRIAGGAWQTMKNVSVRKVNGLFKIQGTHGEQDTGIVLIWQGNEGSHAWSTINTFALSNSSTHQFYSSGYHDFKGNPHISGGSVTITKLGAVNQIIKGAFSVTPTGLITPSSQEIGPSIEGYFTLKRGADL